jgi:hypothetical protein
MEARSAVDADVALEVPVFDRDAKVEPHRFTRIGRGGLGGKGAGLWLIRDRILPRLPAGGFPGFDVDVPPLTVLTSDVFDSFVTRAGLDPLSAPADDDRIALAFQRAELPAEWAGDLRALATARRGPLAVRSSSVLEDRLDHPLAGVYLTKMLPNDTPDDDARFRALALAVKLVWASTWFSAARDARAARRASDESMAVLVQDVVGQRSEDRFYPCVSGVARSRNYYPTGHDRPEDGVVHLALGLGKTIVDGGRTWTYCPASPASPPPFNDVGDLLDNTQTRFWSVRMGPPPVPDPIRETEYLIQDGLDRAEADGALALVASTYDAGSDRLTAGLGVRGPRAVTFAPLLQSRLVPFNDVVAALLDAAAAEVGGDVEIEFAVRLDRRSVLPASFSVLQVRPMAATDTDVTVDDEALADPRAVVATRLSLGNGVRDNVHDVVWMPPDRFDPNTTRDVVRDLERINRRLVSVGTPYLLIGFGRWGTSDDRAGVPVAWGQISGASVIVEATLPDVSPDLSQGSHFFHNVLGFGVLYLSVRWNGPDHVDWRWLDEQTVVEDTGQVVHSRVDRPLEIRVDGTRRRGVVLAR